MLLDIFFPVGAVPVLLFFHHLFRKPISPTAKDSQVAAGRL